MRSCPSAAAATSFNLFHTSAACEKGRGRRVLPFHGGKFWNVLPETRAGLSSFGVLCGGDGRNLPNLGFLTKPFRLLVSSSFSESQAELELVDDDMTRLQLPDQDDSRLVHIRLQLQRECRFGEQFLVVGDHTALGLWNPLDAAPMVWSDSHVWTAEMDLPVGMLIQFKFLLREISGKILWQSGPNRVLQTWETSNTISVFGHWENAAVQHVVQVQDVENQYEEQDELLIDEMQGQKALLETNSSDVSLNEQPVAMVSENIACKPVKDSGYPSKKFHVGRTLKISSNHVVAETRLWKGESLTSAPGPAPCLTTPNEGVTADDHEPELDQEQEEEEEGIVKEYEAKKEGINGLMIDKKHAPSTYLEGQGNTDNDLNHIKWGQETISRILNFLGFV